MFIRNVLLASVACASLNIAAAQPNEPEHASTTHKTSNYCLIGALSGMASIVAGKMSRNIRRTINSRAFKKWIERTQNDLFTISIVSPVNSAHARELTMLDEGYRKTLHKAVRLRDKGKITATIAAITGIASLTAFYYAYKAYRAKKAAAQPALV